MHSPRLSYLVCVLGLVAAQPASAQADLSDLRTAALAAVNQDRMRHGLPPLHLTDALNAAAQAHAEDMLRRGYYDHASPEGRMVGDRFQEQGGSRWALVEENILRCTGCTDAPDAWRLQQDWMGSPSHRENILRHGLSGFGFGIALVQGQVLYAVQAFAGPGAPLGTDAAEAEETLLPSAQVELALEHFNAARRAAQLPPLQISRGLTEIARRMVSNNPDDVIDTEAMAHFDTLSQPGSEWDDVAVASTRCGGCGLRPTAADVAYFAGEFLHRGAADAYPMTPGMDEAGFAMTVDGTGMKSAVLLVGRRRSAFAGHDSETLPK